MATLSEILPGIIREFVAFYGSDADAKDVARREGAADSFADFAEKKAGSRGKDKETGLERGRVSATAIDIRTFLDDGCGDFNREWLKEDWAAIKPLPGMTWKEMDALRVADGVPHRWLISENRHFDMECPEGVASMFDLPQVRRELADGMAKTAPDRAAALAERHEWWAESFEMAGLDIRQHAPAA